MTKSNLTQLPGVPDSGEVRPGMASWEGSGPYGRTCSQCVYKGYQRLSERATLDKRTGVMRQRAYVHGGCAMFRMMTGRNGPNVGSHWKACRYFEERK